MKVAMTVLMVVVLALFVGAAFAGSDAITSEAETPLYNAVTYSDPGPATDCASVRGAGAGAVIPGAEPLFMNGVTQVELGVGAKAIGQCAGRISEEEPAVWMHNGITVFE